MIRHRSKHCHIMFGVGKSVMEKSTFFHSTPQASKSLVAFASRRPTTTGKRQMPPAPCAKNGSACPPRFTDPLRATTLCLNEVVNILRACCRNRYLLKSSGTNGCQQAV